MHLRRPELTQFSLTQRSGRSRAPPWLDSRQWGPNEKSDHEAGPRLGVTEGEGPRPTLDVGLEAWVALTVAGMCRLDSESVQPGPRKSPSPPRGGAHRLPLTRPPGKARSLVSHSLVMAVMYRRPGQEGPLWPAGAYLGDHHPFCPSREPQRGPLNHMSRQRETRKMLLIPLWDRHSPVRPSQGKPSPASVPSCSAPHTRGQHCGPGQRPPVPSSSVMPWALRPQVSAGLRCDHCSPSRFASQAVPRSKIHVHVSTRHPSGMSKGHLTLTVSEPASPRPRPPGPPPPSGIPPASGAAPQLSRQRSRPPVRTAKYPTHAHSWHHPAPTVPSPLCP